jgi:DNA invertase Pin-like site-specific DNA recombinase
MPSARVACPHCSTRLLNADTLLQHMRRRHPVEWQRENPQLSWEHRTFRIYIRVSGAPGQTVENQRQKIAALLTLKGADPEKFVWYEDDETGTTLMRPGIQRLLGDLQRGDVFVCTHPDRLSRRSVDFNTLTHALKAKGADIFATDAPLDSTDPFGRFIWGILGLWAEFEWFRIVDRTFDGLDRVRKQNPGRIMGRHPGCCGWDHPCPENVDHRASRTL